MSDIIWDKTQAENIIKGLQEDGTIRIYADYGGAVRRVNPLLSESQLDALSEKLVEFLEDLLEDIEEEMNGETFDT